ncbi:hypothetical protein QBC38DRAFT_528462 [Podospora fimiseda]|uniref:Uncharacterized protein n=1 Tax=Podospora fimiseda TaxID=252190 RepID=A0AAN7BXL8_9PEZI|nr:hypothetical protein QBC38DRAFT_528462 [Podospora fimiseda]
MENNLLLGQVQNEDFDSRVHPCATLSATEQDPCVQEGAPSHSKKEIQDFLKRLKPEKNAAAAAFETGSWDNPKAEATKAWSDAAQHQQRKRSRRHPFEAVDYAAEKAMTSCWIEFLIELVPYGEYSSLISGGLTLAYNTATRKQNYREDILELFDSLSGRAEQTKANIRLYSRDVDLHTKSEELYMAVLDCVRCSMAWLDRSSAFESFKAFFQQNSRQVNDIHSGVEWLKAPTLATFCPLANMAKEFDLRSDPGQLQPQPQPIPSTMSSWQLMQCLASEYRVDNQDNPATSALSELDMDITRAMQHIPGPFLSWLQASNSGFVMVHEGELSSRDSLSTLSHLCGMMARTLRAPGMSTLVFFCGLHTSAYAKLQGGLGLMCALGPQLLSAIPDASFSIAQLGPLQVAQQLAAGDLGITCSVFTLLIENLPMGMVYVLVDGAQWNSSQARTGDMRSVVRFLFKAVERLREARRGLALKVLITNPSANHWVGWDLQAEDLFMERNAVGAGNRGGEMDAIQGAAAGYRYHPH